MDPSGFEALCDLHGLFGEPIPNADAVEASLQEIHDILADQTQSSLDRIGHERGLSASDMTLRLTELHSLSRVNVWVDRNYTYIGRQIAGVTVMTSPRHPARLPKVARDAFRAPLHDQKIRTQISTANSSATAINQDTRSFRPMRASNVR